MAHITDQQITKYYGHQLDAGEEMELLQHAAQCEYCAGRLAAGIPEAEMISLPRGVTAGILEKAARIPDRKQRQREYYRYCTRVALGVCMALGLMVTVNFQGGWSSQVPSQKYVGAEWERVRPEEIPSEQNSEKLAYQQKLEKEKQKQKEQREKFVAERQRESKREISGWFSEKKK